MDNINKEIRNDLYEWYVWINEHPVGTTLKLKYENRLSVTLITEYEYINKKIYMHTGIHTFILSEHDFYENTGMYLNHTEYKNLPKFSITEDEFLKSF